jgi:hypothetical protein
MVNEGDYVAIFHSIHRVMKAEKLLKREKVEILLIPAPRQLTSDCGLAIRYSGDVRGQVVSVLKDAELSPAEVYLKAVDGFEKVDEEGL